MALVKTSSIGGKQHPYEPAVAEPPVTVQNANQRRAIERQRNRQAKAAERMAAATQELASGITEASAAAEELRRALLQIASASQEAAGAAQQSQVAVASLSRIFADARKQADLSRDRAEALQAVLVASGMQIEALVTAVKDNTERQLRLVGVVAALEAQAANIGEITGIGQ